MAKGIRPKHRAVWFIDAVSLWRYMVVGHKQPNHGPSFVDLTVLEREIRSGGLSEEEMQRKREEGIQGWQQNASFERSWSQQAQCFIGALRKSAPEDIRKRLVIPSLALWIDKHELFGLATRMSVIIPTSARFTATARVDDLIWDDIKRIDIFIAAANELIEDPQLRQEAGFDYERFTPQVIPQREVIMPTFDKEEFYELLRNPELSHLYGTTGFDLLGAYVARDRNSLITVGLLRREDVSDFDYEEAEREACELF